MPQAGREERLRRCWDRHARSYDRQTGFFDRHLFAGSPCRLVPIRADLDSI